MVRVLVHRDGVTREAPAVDPAWLQAGAAERLWVDLDATGDVERRVLAEVFRFHDLAVEDALSEVHHPKIEVYDGFLYLILHGIASGGVKTERGFDTHDVDFFLGPNYLVTVHHAASRSILEEREACLRHQSILGEGPAGVLHRVLDRMVDHYRPEIDRLEERLEELEAVVFEHPLENPLRQILHLKTDVGTLRRVVLPQRDAMSRLARREFAEIPDSMTFRFRDLYDGLVRLTDESMMFQDRVTSLVDAYLSTQSNRLNQVMKVLTVIATIFMPLTVLTGVYGMNVMLPQMPGGPESQFWWIGGGMLALSGAMLWGFRRLGWL